MRRFAGVLAMLIGAATCGYFAWCGHRLSYGVLGGPGWPRPWPYPDEWLLRWERDLDAAEPAPPGHIKFHGELDQLRRLVRLYAECGGLVFAAGLAVAAWPRRRKQAEPGAAADRGQVGFS
jgi:hypothetical protein